MTSAGRAPGAPLRIASLAKQIPLAESFHSRTGAWCAAASRPK